MCESICVHDVGYALNPWVVFSSWYAFVLTS